MIKPAEPTRADRRARRATATGAGVYGIDAQDAGADSWRGRYMFFAESESEAKSRIANAGFHKRQVYARWHPGEQPSEGLPTGLGAGDDHWYRTRLHDSGWSPWEQLVPDYRHPQQGSAASDPSKR